ncbi:MAG: hypothetical protein KF691_02410 [Phycisphaeraceae bacterium]|nr:hypothetical protein [Phycisphaeraceae bacterium]
MPQITLKRAGFRITITPELGAGIADFSVLGPSGFFYPVLRRAAPDETNASLLGCFIMAPWANRIANAKFVFEGKEIALKPTSADGMAQHGDVRKRAWSVTAQDAGSATLEYDSAAHADSNWPWAYRCRVEYNLEEAALIVRLRVLNSDSRAFPAGSGLHPYFSRRLWNDSDIVEVHAPVSGRYPVIAGCATGAPSPDELSRRLATLAPLPDEHIDAVFAGFEGSAEIRWPGSGVTLRLVASSRMRHLVVFAPHANGTSGTPLPFIAVEPQTQVNDGFNLEARGVRGTGTVILKPGEALETECRFEIERRNG